MLFLYSNSNIFLSKRALPYKQELPYGFGCVRVCILHSKRLILHYKEMPKKDAKLDKFV